MWQEARANDKRIKEIMVDHKRRAERRRAYYESRLGDPQQLIRVIGSSTKIYPNAEQFYYHENIDNFMRWQGNPDIKIDRFDGRSLLDYIPQISTNNNRGLLNASREEREMADELNFERYHDLIEAERLNVTEQERLAEVDEEWTKLLDRHQAKLALLDNQEKPIKQKVFGFDYGTNKVTEGEEGEDEEEDAEKESQLLKEVDILQYVDDLTDKDKQTLNEMSSKYGIKSYARLLRVAKKDRDDELRSLKRQRGDDRPKDRPRSANERRRIRRKNERNGRRKNTNDSDRYRRRHSPTYEPYKRSSDSEESSAEEESHTNSDFVIEFGSSTTEENEAKLRKEEEEKRLEEQRRNAPAAPVEKKLTPMEKLKMKMRAGLEKQIVLDEREKRQKEKEKELEHLRELAKSQGLPVNAYMRPEPPTRESVNKPRYRSPSSSPTPPPTQSTKTKERYRSPSLEDNKRYRSPSSPAERKRYRSPSPVDRKRYRSPSPTERKRYRSPSPADRKRYRSPSPAKERKRYRSPSPSRDRYHRHSRCSRSRSPQQKRRYRSPSRDDKKSSKSHKR